MLCELVEDAADELPGFFFELDGGEGAHDELVHEELGGEVDLFVVAEVLEDEPAVLDLHELEQVFVDRVEALETHELRVVVRGGLLFDDVLEALEVLGAKRASEDAVLQRAELFVAELAVVVCVEDAEDARECFLVLDGERALGQVDQRAEWEDEAALREVEHLEDVLVLLDRYLDAHLHLLRQPGTPRSCA